MCAQRSLRLACASTWKRFESLATHRDIGEDWSGPGCSKLTTSLVNDSLKFTSSDTQICWNFLLKKNVSSFCTAKATHIFSAKNFRVLYIESAKTVNEMTLNELVKLTTLWTTGPRLLECAAWSKSSHVTHAALKEMLCSGSNGCCSDCRAFWAQLFKASLA